MVEKKAPPFEPWDPQYHPSSLASPPEWVGDWSPPDTRGLFPTQNLLEIVTLQTRAKYLQSAVDGKYVYLHRNIKSQLMERKRLSTRLSQLNSVLSRVQEDYPQYQEMLQKIQQKIVSKLEPPEPS